MKKLKKTYIAMNIQQEFSFDYIFKFFKKFFLMILLNQFMKKCRTFLRAHKLFKLSQI